MLETVEDANDRGFPLLVEVAASVGLQGQSFVDAIQKLNERCSGCAACESPFERRSPAVER